MRKIHEIVISNLFKNVSHRDTLTELVANAKIIEIVCPFVAKEEVEWLLQNKKPETKVTLLTELSKKGISAGVQSVEAVELLIRNDGKVFFFTERLHAKFFWFDRATALVTSANLTGNGLERNVEIGLCVDQTVFDRNLLGSSGRELTEYFQAIWDFFLSQAEPLGDATLEIFKSFSDSTRDAREELKRISDELSEDLPHISYFPAKAPISNKANIKNNLTMKHRFSGFKLEDWDPFDHSFTDLNKDLEAYKQLLTDKINPILEDFFLQLKHETVFTEDFGSFQIGFSRNRQVKKFFPDSRYLFLKKKRKGRASTWHIREPSFIISMGKSEKGKFLEIRTGVEEAQANELSPKGRELIEKLLADPKEIIPRLRSLGPQWRLSHGNYTRDQQTEIQLDEVTEQLLEAKLRPYLVSGAEADIHIRRKYFLGSSDDREIVLSSRVTRAIAEDMQRLLYFFKLTQN